MSKETQEITSLPSHVLSNIVGFLSIKDRARLRRTSRFGGEITKVQNLDKFDLERRLLERSPGLHPSEIHDRIQCFVQHIDKALHFSKRIQPDVMTEHMPLQEILQSAFPCLCQEKTMPSDFLEVLCELYPSLYSKDRDKSPDPLINVVQLLMDGRGVNLLSQAIRRTKINLELEENQYVELQNKRERWASILTTIEKERDDLHEEMNISREFIRTTAYAPSRGFLLPHQTPTGLVSDLEMTLFDVSNKFKEEYFLPLKQRLDQLNDEFSAIKLDLGLLDSEISQLKARMTARQMAINPNTLFCIALEIALRGNSEALEVCLLLRAKADLGETLHFVPRDALKQALFFECELEFLVRIAKQLPELVPSLLHFGFSAIRDRKYQQERIKHRVKILMHDYQGEPCMLHDAIKILFQRCLDHYFDPNSFPYYANLFKIYGSIFVKSKYIFTAEEVNLVARSCKRSGDFEWFINYFDIKVDAQMLRQYLMTVTGKLDSNIKSFLTRIPEADLHSFIDVTLINACKAHGVPASSFEILFKYGATVRDEAALQLVKWDTLTHVLLSYCIKIASGDPSVEEEFKETPLPDKISDVHFAMMQKHNFPIPSDVFDRVDEHHNFLDDIPIETLKSMLSSRRFILSTAFGIYKIIGRLYDDFKMEDVKPSLSECIAFDLRALKRILNSVSHNSKYDYWAIFARLPLHIQMNKDMLYALCSELVPMHFFKLALNAIDGPIFDLKMDEIVMRLAKDNHGSEKLELLWSLFFRDQCTERDFILLALEKHAPASLLEFLLKIGAPIPKTDHLLKAIGYPGYSLSVDASVLGLLIQHVCMDSQYERIELIRWMISRNVPLQFIIKFAIFREDWDFNWYAYVEHKVICREYMKSDLESLLAHFSRIGVTLTNPSEFLCMCLKEKVSLEEIRAYFLCHEKIKPFRITAEIYDIAENEYGSHPMKLERTYQVLSELIDEWQSQRGRTHRFFGEHAPKTTQNVHRLPIDRPGHPK